MPIMTVTAAIAGLKNAIDLAKAAVAARDELKLAEMQQSINDRVIDVQNAALALQEKQSAARDEIDSMKDEMRTLKATIEQLQRAASLRDLYVLRNVGPGRYVYSLRETAPGQTVNGEVQHNLCQPCFDGPEQRKVVLRYKAGGKVGTMHIPASWTCSVCGTSLSE
jgi:hypothetical protein